MACRGALCQAPSQPRLHVGTFTANASFASAVERLPWRDRLGKARVAIPAGRLQLARSGAGRQWPSWRRCRVGSGVGEQMLAPSGLPCRQERLRLVHGTVAQPVAIDQIGCVGAPADDCVAQAPSLTRRYPLVAQIVADPFLSSCQPNGASPVEMAWLPMLLALRYVSRSKR